MEVWGGVPLEITPCQFPRGHNGRGVTGSTINPLWREGDSCHLRHHPHDLGHAVAGSGANVVSSLKWLSCSELFSSHNVNICERANWNEIPHTGAISGVVVATKNLGRNTRAQRAEDERKKTVGARIEDSLFA